MSAHAHRAGGWWNTHSFKHTGTTLGVPSLEVAVEFLACIEDAVVVVLVMDRPCDAIAKHAFRQRWKSLDWVVLEE